MWKCKEWWYIQLTLEIWCGPLSQHPLPPARHQPHLLIPSAQTINQKKNKESRNEIQLPGLKITNGSYFSGTQKLWIMQHLLVPRIQWPLLIYEMPLSLAARLEQKISTFIRKWLHLHHSMSSLCFYSADSPCPLLIKSLTLVLKASKISGPLLLKCSHEPPVSSSPPKFQADSWEWENCECDRTRH